MSGRRDNEGSTPADLGADHDATLDGTAAATTQPAVAADEPDGDALHPMDTIPSATFDPLLGTMLDGRYLLLSSLGEGGMGHVYQATHVLMDKPVAVKLIHAELAHMTDITKRFEREARSSSRLSDPHCITVTDFGRTDDGSLFLVMELLDGEALSARIDEHGALDVASALRVTAQVLKGLVHAHEQGVVHRDLKPENVMLVKHGDEEDFVKILDFGIAKLASGAGEGESLTRSGVVFGTPKYLSPEQALGDPADHRSDLYAVGIMLYEMLTGQPPYAGESAMDTLSLHLTAPVPSLAEHGDFPRGLQEVVNLALAKKPDERFASAEEFLAAVEEIDPEGAPPTQSQIIENISEQIADLASPGTARRWLRLLWTAIVLAVVIAAGLVLYERFAEEPLIGLFDSVLGGDGAAAQGTQDEQVEILLARAEQQLVNGVAAEAVISAKEALRIKPDHPPALLMQGHGQFLSGERAEAMETYHQALMKRPRLGSDVRLLENLKAAQEWEPCRVKAAWLLGRYAGDEGVQFLADRANSALTPGEERRAARQALVETEHRDAVDWLSSLTADFHELKKCKERRDVITQIGESGDLRFLPLLDSYRPVTLRTGKTTNACIGTAVLEAIDKLGRTRDSDADAGAREADTDTDTGTAPADAAGDGGPAV